MTMIQLVPTNTGGGLKRSPTPSAYLNGNGALVLNLSADELIGGDKWLVFYESDPTAIPTFHLRPAPGSDAGAYTVTRSGGSSSKVTVKLLWQRIKHADKFVGRYSASKIQHGLKLTRVGDE